MLLVYDEAVLSEEWGKRGIFIHTCALIVCLLISYRYKKNKIQQPKAGTPLGCATTNDSKQNNISADDQVHEFGKLDTAGGEEEDTDPIDEWNILSHLTGMPHVDDKLLQVVPVCAPYIVLRDYKYKYGVVVRIETIFE